jgi:hypothetical protein
VAAAELDHDEVDGGGRGQDDEDPAGHRRAGGEAENRQDGAQDQAERGEGEPEVERAVGVADCAATAVGLSADRHVVVVAGRVAIKRRPGDLALPVQLDVLGDNSDLRGFFRL